MALALTGPCNASRAADEPWALLEQGQLSAAEQEARARLAEHSSVRGTPSPAWADAVDVLVESLLRQQTTSDRSVLALAQQAVAAREAQRPVDDDALARSLSGLGRYAHATGDSTQARLSLERALALIEHSRGPNAAAAVPVLSASAGQALERGAQAQARAWLERARRIADATLPHDDRAAVAVLQGQAHLELAAGHDDDATRLLEDARARAERCCGADSLVLAGVLVDCAQVALDHYDMDAAGPPAERALAITERAVGPAHPLLAPPLRNLGLLQIRRGEYDTAQQTLQRALKILEQAPAFDPRELAALCVDSGQLQSELGEPEQARALTERGLTIGRTIYGPDHPLLTGYLNNLAIIAYQLGDYARSEQLFNETLERDEAALGPNHPDLAGELHNLAGVLRKLGRPREALPLLQRALAIQEATRGPDHPTLARTLDNLGNVQDQVGDVAGARSSFDRAIALAERGGASSRTDLATALNDDAQFRLAHADIAGARQAAERALEVRLAVYGPVHPRIAMSVERLARVALAEGQLDSARARLERAVSLRERTQGPEHPALGDALQDLAAVRLRLKDWTGASAAACRAEQIGRNHLRLLARGVAEREALAYAAVRPRGAAIALAAAAGAGDPQLTRAAWDELVRSRSLVLDEMAARRWLASASSDPAVRAKASELQTARTRLARLAVSPSRRSASAQQAALEEARADKERLERALAAQLQPLQRQERADQVGLADVLGALPEHSALVSFARGADAGEQAMTFALVGGPGLPDPVVVPLGAVGTLDSLVARWRASLREGAAPPGPLRANAERAYRSVGRALHVAVWDKLAPRMPGVTRIYLVPDGELSWVNLAALPTDDGGYLIQSAPLLHELATERDLVLDAQESPPPTVARATGHGDVGLLALGGPDFDLSPDRARGSKSTRQAAAATFRGASSDCAAASELRFAPLPAAAQEATDIARIYERGTQRSGRVYVRQQASETRLKLECGGHQVLHLATHGYVLDRACEPWDPASPVAPGQEIAPGDVENPLLLSGLALAAANRRSSAAADEDDGVLTGEEVASLSLDGTEWVVLSACGTGLGQAAVGEGVLGLQRAFRTAGARTLILSLWPVEDAATRAFMTDLYRARFEQHQDTAAALRTASLQALERGRKSGAGTHPCQWAGFIAVGDWH